MRYVWILLFVCGCGSSVEASAPPAGELRCGGADLPACVNGTEFFVDPPCEANPFDAGPYCPEGIPCGQAGSCPHGWTCWGENNGTRYGTCK